MIEAKGTLRQREAMIDSDSIWYSQDRRSDLIQDAGIHTLNEKSSPTLMTLSSSPFFSFVLDNLAKVKPLSWPNIHIRSNTYSSGGMTRSGYWH